MVGRSYNNQAFAVERVTENGFVRIVVARITVADAGNTTCAFDLECYQVVGCRDDAALGVQNIHFDGRDILRVGDKHCAICLEPQ